MIVTRHLRKSFHGVPILKDINLELKKGEITCLIGPSGAGKTTLLRALSLLDPPTSGYVRIGKQEYDFPLRADQNIDSPYPDVTVVFQQLFLWPHLTLRENILLPARNIQKERADQTLEKYVDLFDMRHFIDRHPNEASLGQRQRVAIVRALMLKPSYIFMDEITSALDVEQIAKILEYLQKLRDEGIGIFIITHLLGFARRASDNVLFMDAGKIEEEGAAKILDKPHSKRLKEFVSTVRAAT